MQPDLIVGEDVALSFQKSLIIEHRLVTDCKVYQGPASNLEQVSRLFPKLHTTDKEPEKPIVNENVTCEELAVALLWGKCGEDMHLEQLETESSRWLSICGDSAQ